VEDAMGATTRMGAGIGVLVVCLALVVGADARGADDKALRDELLKLNQATTEDLQNAKFRALMKDRAKAKQAVTEAVKMLKEAGEKETPFNYNATLILGSTASRLKQYDAAEKLIELQVDQATKLKSGKKMVDSYVNLIDLYMDSKRFNDAIDACERFMDLTGPDEVENAQPFILAQLITAKARSGKTDEAMNLAKGMVAKTGSHWFFLQVRGQVEREAGKIDEAIKTYNEVIDKLEAFKDFKGDEKEKRKDGARYALSGLYVENKQIDKAAEQLQTLIKRNPEAATYKNDLGFIWCDHDMKLDESEKLIREALELDKKAKQKLLEEKKIDEITENAAYLDSMGWVLFKKKKYKEALEYLKKAAADEDDGNHLEIWDHLGDCHMALGQRAEAIAAWEKALKMEDISKRDGERRRKVSEKLRDAKAAKG
jgi:tetratricopeptide (TPR) repeat protein